MNKTIIDKRTYTYSLEKRFDVSFSVEDSARDDEFLGEHGATNTIIFGEEQEGNFCINIWLFDKEDFVRTINANFISSDKLIPHTANEEYYLIEQGVVATLYSKTLGLDIAVTNVLRNQENAIISVTFEVQAYRITQEEQNKAKAEYAFKDFEIVTAVVDKATGQPSKFTFRVKSYSSIYLANPMVGIDQTIVPVIVVIHAQETQAFVPSVFSVPMALIAAERALNEGGFTVSLNQLTAKQDNVPYHIITISKKSSNPLSNLMNLFK